MKDFRTIYKALAKNKQNTAIHMVQLMVLKAITAKSNTAPHEIAQALLSRAFSKVTNKNKRRNGVSEFFALHRALIQCKIYNARIFNVGKTAEDFFDSKEEYDRYIQCLSLIDIGKLTNDYVYIFVAQKNIPPVHQLVQSAHVTMVAGFEIAKKFGDKYDPNNIYFQVIGLPDAEDVTEFSKTLKPNSFVTFTEPDMGHKVTALCTFPMNAADRGNFRNHNLLVFEEENNHKELITV